MSQQFCQHCAELPGELTGNPAGSQMNVGGVECYVTRPGSSRGQIVLATDIFGLGITNSKIVADQLQKETGYTVTVPDYFRGTPMRPEVSQSE